MPCFHPLKAFKGLSRGETGKYGIVFNPTKALIEGSSFNLPCGQCRGCRIDKARDWSVRCGHEAQMHDRNCFVTLTYDAENVPRDYSVRKRDLQLMNMRVREFYGSGIKHFGVGEYGDEDGRPHLHVLYFGLDFDDKKPWAKRNGYQTWRSDRLEKLWPFGHSEIGSVTAESAGYCARYCLKKVTGKPADDFYFRLSPIDGEMHRVEPEFALMSRRPGIGSTWFDKFKSDCFPSDFVVVDGQPKPVPRFYVSKLAEAEAKALDKARLRKEFRDLPARARRRADNTPARLAVREEVAALRQKRLIRSL